MNYTKTQGEKSTVKLSIAFSEEEWQEALGKSYLRVRTKYTVPGFRKGKAPRPVLENFYGKGVLYEEAFSIIYSAHYPEILEKEKENFTAVGEPELDVEEMKEGEGVKLSAIVPVKPEVVLEQYTGLKIRKFEYNVTDADVDRELEKQLSSGGEDVEVTDRPCRAGDTVNINFSGRVDGELFPGGTAEEYDLKLGSGSFIPGFEEGVEGMNIADTRDITVKFPDDYQADNLRGKEAAFTVKLNKIKSKKLPELTDEYVKSHFGEESVEAYKTKTRERLVRNAENRGRDETETSIVNAIAERATVEIPDAMTESEIDRMVNEFSYRLAYQGLKLEDYLKYMKQSMDDFRSQFRSQAETRVKNQLVIDKIIKSENITATEEEVNAKIEEQAKSVGKTADEYKKNMEPRQTEYITNDIIITKLFSFLSENNELCVEEPASTAPAKKTRTGTAKKSQKSEAADKPE